MNALPAQLCVLDESGRIITTNERWVEFARNNHGDLNNIGQGINYLNVCAQAEKKGDKRAKIFADGLKAVLGKQQAEFSMDYKCSSPNTVRWFTARVTRFPDPGPIRAVVSHTDITERKALEEAIRKYNEELETTVEQRTSRIQELEQRRMQMEKLAALAQISAGVAHEINNPLASISQSLVLLKRAISPEHPHFRYMAKVEDCIGRIAQITKHLYQLYRPSNPIPTPIDIKRPILSAVEIMQARASTRHVNITVVTLSTPVLAFVSEGELTQVLCNLLQNAIDASNKQSEIELHLTAQPDTLTIRVSDHGLGIPPEVASHIFEPFFTTKQDRMEGGMGLGLSISHSFVESMGGTLDFTTTIGQGSTFRITLPSVTQNGGPHERTGNGSAS